jgi:tripartite-type tricarboxylate transporter receptor subunit TctC
MKKFTVLLLAISLLSSMVLAEGAQEDYPVRDITDVVVWGAGGGTDTANRIVMAEMSKVLGVNINVINKTGGTAGSVGMNYGFTQPRDGYTLVGISESNTTTAVQGAFNQRFDVWDMFIVGGSPDLISVTPDAPFQTLEELIEYAKANPGEIDAGASGAGSIHHLNLLALEDGTGADFNFIPYPGSAPSQTAAMTGEITLVVTSLQEQAQLIRGGKLRPLAMLVNDPVTLDGINIPSAFDSYPGLTDFLPISQAIGFALHADAPQVAKDAITEAFLAAMETEAVKQWAEDSYVILSGKYGDEANAHMAKLESLFGWKLYELGAAQIDPASLGIPRP